MLKPLCSFLDSKIVPPSKNHSVPELPSKSIHEAPSLLIAREEDLLRLDADLEYASQVFIDYQGDICGRVGKISLVTIGIETRSSIIAYSFDFKTCNEDREHVLYQRILRKFQSIIENPAIMKVIHQSSELSDILYYQFHMNLTTQIIDTSYCLQKIENSTHHISLDIACSKYCDEAIIQNDYIHIDWDRRPVSYDMLVKSSHHLTQLHNLYLHLKSNEAKYKMVLKLMVSEFESYASEYRKYPCHGQIEIPYYDRALFQSKRCHWLKSCEEEYRVRLLYMSHLPRTSELETIFILADNEALIETIKERIRLRMASFHSSS